MLLRICLLIAVATASLALEYSCPVNGQHFFSHPKACDKFVECNNGAAKELDCIPGLEFNPSLGYCDFPSNVVCIIEEDVTEEVGSGPVGECPPENGAYVTFLTDATDYTIFYKCNWGTPFQYVCPDGLYFNPVLNVCDNPEDAGRALP